MGHKPLSLLAKRRNEADELMWKIIRYWDGDNGWRWDLLADKLPFLCQVMLIGCVLSPNGEAGGSIVLVEERV